MTAEAIAEELLRRLRAGELEKIGIDEVWAALACDCDGGQGSLRHHHTCPATVEARAVLRALIEQTG